MIKNIKIVTIIFILIIVEGVFAYSPTFATDDKFTVKKAVSMTLDNSNKNQLQIDFKDSDGIKEISITANKSNGEKIKTYKVSGNQINSNKDLDKDMNFKKYNSKTNIASIIIKKNYFANYSYKKDNRIIFTIKTTDKSSCALTSSEKVDITYDKGKWKKNMAARISGVKYNNGVMTLTMSDYNGIITGKASLKITDKNNSGKVILNAKAASLKSKLKNQKKSDGIVVKGTYDLNIKKLKIDKKGYYKLKAETTDATGMSRVQEIALQKKETTKKEETKKEETKKEETKKEETKKEDDKEKVFLTNREVRTDIVTSNKDQVKLEFEDCAGIEELNVTTYTSKNKKIKEYKVSGEQFNNDQKLDNYIKLEKYNKETNIASLVIEKEYFTEKSYKKDNKINFVINTKDKSKNALTSSEKLNLKYDKGTWKSNRGTRVNTKYNDGYLYLTTMDYSGVAKDKAALKVTDKNNNGSVVIDEKASSLASKLTDVEKRNDKIVKGTYKLDINKLKMDKDGYYCFYIEATDGIGTTRIQNIALKKKKQEICYIFNESSISEYPLISKTYSGTLININSKDINYNSEKNSYLYCTTAIPNKYNTLHVSIKTTEQGKYDWAACRVGIRPTYDSDGSASFSNYFIPEDWLKMGMAGKYGMANDSDYREYTLDLTGINASSYYFYLQTAGQNWSINKIWFE